MIGEQIKAARKAKDVSQEELAVRLGVVRQTVSKWENGMSVPDADVLIKIAELLDVPVSQLLGIEPESGSVQDMAGELARLNKELAAKIQKEKLRAELDKKRGVILLLSFGTLIAALTVKIELLSLLLAGACMLTMLAILYRNLTLFTGAAADKAGIGALRAATIFDAVVLLLALTVAALDKTALVALSEDGERLLAAVIMCGIMLFGGFISPRLPYNRHTGLRLPWTVRDEDTWNVAHRVLGYISLPMTMLYLAAALTVRNADAAAAAATVCFILWIGIPGLVSYIFFWKKLHGKA